MTTGPPLYIFIKCNWMWIVELQMEMITDKFYSKLTIFLSFQNPRKKIKQRNDDIPLTFMLWLKRWFDKFWMESYTRNSVCFNLKRKSIDSGRIWSSIFYVIRLKRWFDWNVDLYLAQCEFKFVTFVIISHKCAS